MTIPEPQPASPPSPPFQFSLRTLLWLPLLLALVLGVWPYAQRRYSLWRLQDYVDQDLQTLPDAEKQRVNGWIATVVGDSARLNPFWLLHTTKMPAADRQTCLVQTGRIFGRPGEYYFTVHTVDSCGRLVRSTEFATRMLAELAPGPTVAFDESHGFLGLRYDMRCGDYSGRWQYFVISDKGVELLRIEKSDGTFRTLPHPYSPPESSRWESLLESPDRLQQLRGLKAYWYDGHFSPPKPLDDKVRQRLADLANSPDPWISEEAKMALAEAKGNF